MIRPFVECGCVLFDICTQQLSDLLQGYSMKLPEFVLELLNSLPVLVYWQRLGGSHSTPGENSLN